ncbi:S9 family peptidase [Polaribacter filamentus]|uniref:S9 family peptidase n=1 Tax=Polaribacter filamentus TaxID=53483 RepID=A0A2S7L072_9FLAO|nr:DPP IV N-terminal domain-containing protein [Polaribacter filamentus]PQB08138.1 S9 family peptidase [Polaribacter filamentus]
MKNSILFFVFLFTVSVISAQETPTPNYRQAAKYAPENLAKMVHSTDVNPHWLKKGNRFWYAYKTSDGSNHYLVDLDKKSKNELFDNVKMAKWLTEITKDPYDAKHLPKLDFKFNEAENAIHFRVESTEEVEFVDEKEDIENDSISTKSEKTKTPKMEKKTYYLEYRLGSNGLKIINTKKEEKKPWEKWANIAPDSSIVLYSKQFNLYWMDKINFKKFIKNEKDSTVVENQWTKDGEDNYGYGGSSREDNVDKDENKDKRKGAWGTWSHDSKKFVFEKSDSRHIKDLWVINSTGKKRPTLETYKYHMPGEQEYYKSELLIFDIPTKTHVKVPLDTVRQQSLNVFRAPRKQSDRDDDFTPSLLLSKKGKLYFSVISRDRKKYDVCVADINTGEYKVLIEERFNTYIESAPLILFNNETEMLHWAERDGWAHFYLYDANGNLKNQVTEGDYHVAGFEGLDEKSRTLYFTANGVNKEHDPYYAHTYKISLNGSGMKTLDPGDFTTTSSMSDSNQYFVNNFSRVNTTPKSEVRDTNGKLVLDLETADLSQLLASGYQFPEPFKVKADDGITDIYGVMYKPFDMDSTKVYPLLEYVYPGPQTEAVNKSFSYRMDRLDRMAQVGFVVITLGNRGGHPDRSKWYHNYGYGNLRDYGLADKKYVAQQLANKHQFIDIDKVGIYGHSGGGFMSTAAMLVYPDFFKAAVSSAGNHDNRVYNSWWSETHHGVKEEIDEKGKISYKYDIDYNQSLAKNLKGHLMLIHGDMDNNVHPAGTIRMAEQLIKAHKRFEFMIMPGQRHGFGDMTEYSFWLRADHFSKYLLGKEATDIDILYMNMDDPKNK